MSLSLKHRFHYAVAIPASFTSDIPHLREKTFRIGLLARAAAIFRVNEIIVYPDNPKMNQSRDIRLIETILTYMETPQYLRKRLFRIMPELQYAGTLPPLRTPHHPTADKTESLHLGEYRDGLVVSHSEGGSLVDIGVENEAFVPHEKRRANQRVTIRISELGRHPKAVFASPSEIGTYWGYTTTVLNGSLGELLQQKPFDLTIATSKKGKHIISVFEELREKWTVSKKTLLAFGAPSQGLYEILSREQLKLEEVADFVVNTIPNQGTETVRTEEALCATLSIFNTLNEQDRIEPRHLES